MTKNSVNILFLLVFAPAICLAQASQAAQQCYGENIEKAKGLHQSKAYPEAARQYSEAFKCLGWKGYLGDRYGAARSWSMAGVPDSAFFMLFKITDKLGFDQYDNLVSETDFEALHSDARWVDLCSRVKANQPTRPDLMKVLDIVYEDDQKYRQMIDSIGEKFGSNSPEMTQLWKIIQEKDSINEVIVTDILDKYGWLGPHEIGNATSALFLVIQHADIDIQEKYLPMMREATQQNKARKADLALLEDRILMRNGKKQLYGSQIRSDPATGVMYVYPIEDVDHVEERRASMGLGPLVEYAAYFNINWDKNAIEENRKRAPGPPDPRK